MEDKIIVPKERVRNIIDTINKEMQEFFEKNIKDCSEPLILILKAHLYIEVCLNEIFKLVIPRPQKIINNRKFSDKMDIFESLNLSFGIKEICKKVRLINKLRNKFSHDLNAELEENEIRPLLKDIQLKENAPNIENLKTAILQVLSFLHFIRGTIKLFPFYSATVRNREIFREDDGFRKMQIRDMYAMKEFRKEFPSILREYKMI